ncbi:metal-dependent hydrolase [Elizabethkingia argentiflava]|uniref:Metal-dependent hydrolase n=1 Tax=Elizabethkingia argenteiflava TaxID=2681556 RepID=A0A845PVI1_9FLAO|nr:metal-dependent hydrolase [Elizabethkingia argenteiflava]NAW50981.1 metal-dependent hydrolase [Elizabethkingia argenteiflava]
MKFTFLGQNCFLFHYKGKSILSDPFYNYQKEQSGFDIKSHKIDYILLTHAHGDHIADVDEVLKYYPEACIIGVPEVCGYFEKAQHTCDLNLGGSTKIDDLKISMVAAYHTSSFPDGKYGGVPVGYIFKFPDERNIYLAGDTGVMADMELFPRLFGKIALAILPIGGHYTMCPMQGAFAASELLKTSKVIGCHFDTFPPIKIDHPSAMRHFEEKNVNLVLPKLGEEFKF